MAWNDGLLCVAQPPDRSEQNFQPEDLMCAQEDSLESQGQGPLWTAPISSDEARRALKAAETLASTSPSDALLQLRLVERAMPRIADRIALRRAELLLQLSRPEEACDAYRIAAESPERNVAAAGRIGLARCMLEANQHQGEAELEKVCKRYPRLGERYTLRYYDARAKESWHDRLGAMAMYRSIDLEAPETKAATDSRAALDRLRDEGVHVPPMTALETVDRGERLFLRGSIEAGRSAIADLLTMNTLPNALKGRVQLIAARAARLEGRWDDTRAHVAAAMAVGIPAGEAMRFLPRINTNTQALDPGAGEAKIRKLLAGHSPKKLKTGQLRAVLDIAIQYQLSDDASEVLAAISSRANMPPQARFDAAIVASGVASDETVLDAFAGLRDVHPYVIAATYHHAHALQRLGRDEEARAEYRRVIELDVGRERYYSVWAEARLSGYEQMAAGTCQRDPQGNCLPDTGLRLPAAAATGGSDNNDPFSAPPASAATAAPLVGTVFGEPAREAASLATAKRENIVMRLGALASVYGGAYPWLARAADLAELERYDDAASEVGEAYLAWRDACGSMRMRAGVEAVLTNAAPARRMMTGPMRRDRLALGSEARAALADVADLLGESGVALRLRDLRSEQRPRAYAEDVEAAAAKFGIDPNLLFAVMRVESVYYKHIVSFAGAVGLMQIMPLTGLRIARALGVPSYDALDLLEPRKNLEFAAWYLSSLITRFDGRLPLAIAAYNGGPHNVRFWLSNHPTNMPLDAFLERIPFTETHHYVRRVLNHYAAYRAQQGLPMPNLADTLPTLKVDTIAF